MLKIACYGYVKKESGSVTGANFLMLQELLERGYKIDFFGWKDSNFPFELIGCPNFVYYELPKQSIFREFIKGFLPKLLHNTFNQTLGALMQNLYSERRNQKNILKAVVAQHAIHQYDLLLFLGLYGTFNVDGVPTVSWVQGPPQTEWHYIHKLQKILVQLCGPFVYWQLKAFYTLKYSRLRFEVWKTDIFICGSKWSKEQLVAYGIQPGSIKILPYPMDIPFFNDESQVKKSQSTVKTFLWLGRIDPRKRLDLMMEAFALLLAERQDVRLKIIGAARPMYKGYKQLIDSFEAQEHIEYQPSLSRSTIPDLIKSCDVLIQPSEGENFGSAVAEALCCGVPVILGPTNGTQDFTSPTCCFLFEDYTPEAVKQTMLEALEKIEYSADTISSIAVTTARKNFQLEKVVDNLEEVFQQAVDSYYTRFSNQIS
ncbi:MAG: glycosyltransferase [Drouetiella hepatica Uher 2000/2452]|jgi:glycosyltransferase involved in cell wall biosynthesis|uniref:Glycosyltransferase n=1 Tax=Drouetiella hepatica Uher 2000/2452 TaxID=904376 RepID=A0A951QA69_9CYAN|nr:glycosyltransferase [Drouetiella hepatica Uher 2000/2452]